MKDLVLLARKTIEEFFKTGKVKIEVNKKFQDKKGIFVTIDSYPDNELRGCVGFAYPQYPLSEAVQKVAIEATFHDSRFPPLTEEELDNVVFEVSVLSLPEMLNGTKLEEKIEKIKNGEDGVILEYGTRKSLFLPQVWQEIPHKHEFLEALCWKCGLTPDIIYDKNTNLYKFNVKAFKEVEPKGRIIEIDFKKK